MLVGNVTNFALESEISEFYSKVSFLGLGFFNIYLNEMRYGVRRPDASMIACSFDEISKRIERRGQHVAGFGVVEGAVRIARSYIDAVYKPNQENAEFFGMTYRGFNDLLSTKNLVWIPDGDQAFDDGSNILQFDVNEQVRLVAFKRQKDGFDLDISTLSDKWMPADIYYNILQEWCYEIDKEWKLSVKV